MFKVEGGCASVGFRAWGGTHWGWGVRSLNLGCQDFSLGVVVCRRLRP